MKYLVIDIRKYINFVEEFDNKEKAIMYAKDEFDRMCKTNPERCIHYFVLESVNPDKDTKNHYEGDVIYRLK